MSSKDEESDIIIDIPRFDEIPRLREVVAKQVALLIVYVFAGTLFLLIILTTAGTAAWGLQFGTDAAVRFVEMGILPLLGALGTFTAILFGPLLAFVLGYYFGQKN